MYNLNTHDRHLQQWFDTVTLPRRPNLSFLSSFLSNLSLVLRQVIKKAGPGGKLRSPYPQRQAEAAGRAADT